MTSSIALAIATIVLMTQLAVSPAQAQSTPEQKPVGILLAAGDISTCDNGKKEKWLHYANRIAEIIRTEIQEAGNKQPPVPVRVFALGDLAYGKGTKEQFNCFADRWKGFDDVLLPVPGNHEYLTPDGADYFDHFADNPFVNQNGHRKGYFALNFPHPDGPWILIGLNDNFEDYPKYREEMKSELAWLIRQLDSRDPTKQPCVLAFWHAPTFSSGKHGHDYRIAPDTALTVKRPMQAALRILYQHGASVVLNGHDHDYEQFSPHDHEGKPVKDGIRSFVVGTGGALLSEDSYTHPAPNSEVLYGTPEKENRKLPRTKPLGIQGVLKIELFEDSYRWDFIPIDATKKFPLPTTAASCNKRR